MSDFTPEAAAHPYVNVGHCAVCGHHGEDCTGSRTDADTPENRLRAGRALATVQRLQSEFWEALRDLEDVIGDIRDQPCELDGAKDFNDLDLKDVLEGRGNDGEEA